MKTRKPSPLTIWIKKRGGFTLKARGRVVAHVKLLSDITAFAQGYYGDDTIDWKRLPIRDPNRKTI